MYDLIQWFHHPRPLCSFLFLMLSPAAFIYSLFKYHPHFFSHPFCPVILLLHLHPLQAWSVTFPLFSFLQAIWPLVSTSSLNLSAPITAYCSLPPYLAGWHLGNPVCVWVPGPGWTQPGSPVWSAPAHPEAAAGKWWGLWRGERANKEVWGCGRKVELKGNKRKGPRRREGQRGI